MAAYGVLNCKNAVLKGRYHYISSDFGKRSYYNSAGKKVSDFHKGVDVQAKAPGKVDYIVCPWAGTVVSCQNSISGQTTNTGTLGMGNYVIIDCGNSVRLRFMHMKKGSVTVKTGDDVSAGQVIGYMGLTGNTNGYHLHFDISIGGTYIDPKPYLAGAKSFGKYTTGTYEVADTVNVRKGAGTNYSRVLFEGFTANAQAQVKKLDKSCPDAFPKGVRVSISEVSGTWGKCPSGWLSLNYCRKVG